MTSDSEPNTPGPLGYLVTFALSLGIFALGYGFVNGSREEFGLVVGAFLFFGVMFGGPIALVTVPVVHVLVRNESEQWVHVLAAGVLGSVGVGLFLYAVGDGTGGSEDYLATLGFVAGAGLATAAARAAVIPLVVRRRRAVAAPIWWRVLS